MTQKELSKRACVDYGVAVRPLAGESLCGDAGFVRATDDGVLLAAIDGIGHGRQAADAAATAVAVLENALDLSLVQLVQQCHRALVQKRGVAMTVVSIQSGENLMSWLGVGNVGCSLFVADRSKQCWKSMLPQRGIVGYQLPRLQLGQMAIAPGNWLVFSTDGVRDDFEGGLALNGPPQEVATRILARHFKGNDDALVLAARYRGKGDE